MGVFVKSVPIPDDLITTIISNDTIDYDIPANSTRTIYSTNIDRVGICIISVAMTEETGNANVSNVRVYVDGTQVAYIYQTGKGTVAVAKAIIPGTKTSTLEITAQNTNLSYTITAIGKVNVYTLTKDTLQV